MSIDVSEYGADSAIVRDNGEAMGGIVNWEIVPYGFNLSEPEYQSEIERDN